MHCILLEGRHRCDIEILFKHKLCVLKILADPFKYIHGKCCNCTSCSDVLEPKMKEALKVALTQDVIEVVPKNYSSF